MLWDQRPWAERTKARSSPSYQPTASINEFKRVLGCVTCELLPFQCPASFMLRSVLR